MSPIKIVAAATALSLLAAPALAATKYKVVKRPVIKTERVYYGQPVIPLSSPTPPSRAYRLGPDDPFVISNGPVPDTPGNRARFGQPMSHAGRMTAPVGN